MTMAPACLRRATQVASACGIGEGRAGRGGRHSLTSILSLTATGTSIEGQMGMTLRRQLCGLGERITFLAQRDENGGIVMGANARVGPCDRCFGAARPRRCVSAVGYPQRPATFTTRCRRSQQAPLQPSHLLTPFQQAACQPVRRNAGGLRACATERNLHEMTLHTIGSFCPVFGQIGRAGSSLRVPRVQIFPRFIGREPRARSWHRACDIALGDRSGGR